MAVNVDDSRDDSGDNNYIDKLKGIVKQLEDDGRMNERIREAIKTLLEAVKDRMRTDIEPDWAVEGGYARLYSCHLYYHAHSGYYYEATTQQFLAPATNYHSNQVVDQSESLNEQSEDNNTGTHSHTTGTGSHTTGTDSHTTGVDTHTSEADHTTDGSHTTGTDSHTTADHTTDGSHTTGTDSHTTADHTTDGSHTSGTDTQSIRGADAHTGAAMTGDIASQLAAVSERASHQYGFAYDSSSGLYYDNTTGWYYDQSTQLYYDADSGTYYTYDYDQKQYQFHSHVEIKPTVEYDTSIDECTIKSHLEMEERIVEEYKPTQLDLMFDDDVEEDEYRTSSISDIPSKPPPMSEWPPCLRLIPQDDKSMKKSELGGERGDARNCISLITAEGVVIGREVSGPHSLRIVDIMVSKEHCRITYVKRKEMYAITDCGSQNGTYINGNRLCEPKVVSQPYVLQHGDKLTIGSSPFLIHIHRGMSSCSQCSQLGLNIVGSQPGPSEPLDVQRRKGLNKIKKKYGLRVKDTYHDNLHQLPDDYTDKAAIRRQTVGSDLPLSAVRDDPGSSLDRALGPDNKGHQMMLNIGWKEGETLGANDRGIDQPILPVLREEKVGLGYGANSAGPSSAIHRKMTHRYHEVSERDAKRKKS